jgi:hypothetical protein
MPNAETFDRLVAAAAPADKAAFPPKIFAHPFRLTLENAEGAHVFVEVRSLAGLKHVFKRIADGELFELPGIASVQMQLWGLLAEHSGFMRPEGLHGFLGAGIEPLGTEAGALSSEMSAFDPTDDGIKLMNEVVGLAQRARIRGPEGIGLSPSGSGSPPAEVENPMLDGAKLSTEGERLVEDLVAGRPVDEQLRPETKELYRQTDMANELLKITPPADYEIDQEGKIIGLDEDADSSPPVVGEEATEAGLAVEAARELPEEIANDYADLRNSVGDGGADGPDAGAGAEGGSEG